MRQKDKRLRLFLKRLFNLPFHKKRSERGVNKKKKKKRGCERDNRQIHAETTWKKNANLTRTERKESLRVRSVSQATVREK